MAKILFSLIISIIFAGCSLSQIGVDSDNDGVFNHKDICKNTPKNAKVDKFGCAIDSDNDGVIDLYDKCADTSLLEIVNAEGCPKK